MPRNDVRLRPAHFLAELDEVLVLAVRARTTLEEGTDDEHEEDELEQRATGVVPVRGPDVAREDGRAGDLVERALELAQGARHEGQRAPEGIRVVHGRGCRRGKKVKRCCAGGDHGGASRETDAVRQMPRIAFNPFSSAIVVGDDHDGFAIAQLCK